MKNIAIDFQNKMIGILTAGKEGTEHGLDLQKEDFYPFIPEKYREYDSFTWNFEDETFTVNKEYHLEEGAIMTIDCFLPQVIVPLKGLKEKYQAFIDCMSYEEINLIDELPDDLKGLLGW